MAARRSSPQTRAAMVGDIVRTAPYKPAVAYGLGVQAVRIAGHPTLGHSGRFLGRPCGGPLADR